MKRMKGCTKKAIMHQSILICYNPAILLNPFIPFILSRTLPPQVPHRRTKLPPAAMAQEQGIRRGTALRFPSPESDRRWHHRHRREDDDRPDDGAHSACRRLRYRSSINKFFQHPRDNRRKPDAQDVDVALHLAALPAPLRERRLHARGRGNFFARTGAAP